ncbi:MAG TPA: hypothetical protein VHN98_05430 [Acidimicrobiales bacterium]|nr:hypothetical protein [Acidimicrobiales bacterium]
MTRRAPGTIAVVADPDGTARPAPASAGGPARRVAIVHRQTKPTLALAVGFALASAVAAVIPHRTGAWLPLHLFLVGGLLLAISGATQLFAVTWAAGNPGPGRLVAVQRGAIAGGATLLAVARELALPVGVVAVAGTSVLCGLLLLGVLLAGEVRSGSQRRFDPALAFYLAAVVSGTVGSILGIFLAAGHAGLRDAHLVLNLLGLVGLVIAGTLPFFVATETRMKTSRRATAAAQVATLAWLVLGVGVAAGASATGAPRVFVAAGLVVYAVGLLQLLSLLPLPGAKQLRWAGPRVLQLAAGVVWWVAACAAAAGSVVTRGLAWPEHLVLVLVVPGFAQILVGSLAYLAPVLRGGGHERLTAGFAITRSWTSFVVANLAGVALAVSWTGAAIALIAVWALDSAWRAARLVTA